MSDYYYTISFAKVLMMLQQFWNFHTYSFPPLYLSPSTYSLLILFFFFFRKIEPAAFEDITHICPLYSFFYEWTILEGSSRLLKKRVSGIEYNATLLQTSIPKGYILWAQSFSYLVTDKVNFSKIYYYFILLFSYR